MRYESFVAYHYLRRLWDARNEQDYRLINTSAIGEFQQAQDYGYTQLLGTLSSVRVLIDQFVTNLQFKDKGEVYMTDNVISGSGYYAWMQARDFAKLIGDHEFPMSFTFENPYAEKGK